MAQLKMTARKMVEDARARIREIDSVDAIGMSQDANVTFVDLRDVRERAKSGFIPGSLHCPRGMLEFWVDPDSPYHNPIFSEDRTFVFHCAIGWRSALSVATLQDMGFVAAHITDGFEGWVQAGGPVEMSGEKPR